jgi:1,4-dihydroxy-2-naphthoyl-CoA synthase
MEYEQILYKPGKVTQIVFNRPEYLNAKGYHLLAKMDRAFTAACRAFSQARST